MAVGRGKGSGSISNQANPNVLTIIGGKKQHRMLTDGDEIL